MKNHHIFLLRGLGVVVVMLVFAPTVALCYDTYDNYTSNWDVDDSVNNNNYKYNTGGSSYSSGGSTSGGSTGSTGSSGSTGSTSGSLGTIEELAAKIGVVKVILYKPADSNLAHVLYYDTRVQEKKAIGNWSNRKIYRKSADSFTQADNQAIGIISTNDIPGENNSIFSVGYMYKTRLDAPAPAPVPTPAPTPAPTTVVPTQTSVSAPATSAPASTPVAPTPAPTTVAPPTTVTTKAPVTPTKVTTSINTGSGSSGSVATVKVVATPPTTPIVNKPIAVENLNQSLPAGAKLVFVENIDGVYTVFDKETGAAVPLAFYSTKTKQIYYGNSDELYGKMLTENMGYIEPNKFTTMPASTTGEVVATGTLTVNTDVAATPVKQNPIKTTVQKVANSVAKVFGGISGWVRSLFGFSK